MIRGVSQTTLAGAQSLVASGGASKSDFWLFVGYAGWAPRQLEGEVGRATMISANYVSRMPMISANYLSRAWFIERSSSDAIAASSDARTLINMTST